MRNYVEKVVQERVLTEASGPSTTVARPSNGCGMCVQVDKELERYKKFLEDKEVNNGKVVEALEMG